MDEALYHKNILITTASFPPVSYLKTLLFAEKAYIEQYENYIKQSYRNRYVIAAANGLLSLSIPVVLATNKKIKVKDVKIDYDTNWQKQHFKSIESAYRNSAFYDYIIQDFEPFFSKKVPFLLDFNLQVLNVVQDIADFKVYYSLTTGFVMHPENCHDLRNQIHPKKHSDLSFDFKEYPQVFVEKYGFKPDLSCLDLIFNLGNETHAYLIGKY
ncbi:MAG: WbqC family protein [Bacteroidales bacterium]